MRKLLFSFVLAIISGTLCQPMAAQSPAASGDREVQDSFPGGIGTVDAFGAQVYSGTESAPTFVLGTYLLNNDAPDGPLEPLVISAPEPSSLLLSLIGIAMLALLCFARKKTVA